MDTSSTGYLEAVRTEELVDILRATGYEVKTGGLAGEGFDLVASKGSERLAIEVKARSTLKDSIQTIEQLRKKASDQGFTEFRLVVVNPPRPVEVEVEGLDQSLAAHLYSELPPELDGLSSETLVQGVTNVEISGIHVTRDGIRVSGIATVDVQMNYDGGSSRDGLTFSGEFPLDFDVSLDQSLKLDRINELKVDTSSFYE
jgi:hypothetical protein